MSSRLDYAKQKRRDAGRHGEHDAHGWNTRGWRTEYPQDFPVTRTSLYDPRGTRARPETTPTQEQSQEEPAQRQDRRPRSHPTPVRTPAPKPQETALAA